MLFAKVRRTILTFATVAALMSTVTAIASASPQLQKAVGGTTPALDANWAAVISTYEAGINAATDEATIKKLGNKERSRRKHDHA
jgi:hypothetical protein